MLLLGMNLPDIGIAWGENPFDGLDDDDDGNGIPDWTQLPAIKIDTVNGPVLGMCGKFSWKTNFTLTKASKKGGWFVQEVKWDWIVKNCDGTINKAKSKSYHFWEAWKVLPGGTQDELVANKTFNYADNYADSDAGGCTKGESIVVGKLSFYEGLKLPAGFIANNPATVAGALPSTNVDPNLKGGTLSQAHNYKTTWDCCPKMTDRRPTKLVFRTPAK